MKLHGLLIVIFSTLSLMVFGQQLSFSKLDFEGRVKDVIPFTDSTGEYIALTSETGEYEDSDENCMCRSAKLFAYLYKKNERNEYQRVWRVYDFIDQCPVDLYAAFEDNAFVITDLNNDGVAEIWMVYKTSCKGDITPNAMKIIMYQGTQKYAMRGNAIGIMGYENDYKFDKAFEEAPQSFRNAAVKLWRKHMRDK